MEVREIDAWIATEVFGPKPETRPNWSHQTEGGWTSSFKGIFTHKDYPPNQVGYPEPWYDWIPLPFSTDPAASKQLREKLAEMGWNYDLGRFGSKPALFTLTLYRAGIRHSADSGEGEEHVFCLCALKAISRREG